MVNYDLNPMSLFNFRLRIPFLDNSMLAMPEKAEDLWLSRQKDTGYACSSSKFWVRSEFVNVSLEFRNIRVLASTKLSSGEFPESQGSSCLNSRISCFSLR
jgi:hypothetical protein